MIDAEFKILDLLYLKSFIFSDDKSNKGKMYRNYK